LFQHLIKSRPYETLNQVQGDKIVITTQSRGGEGKMRANFRAFGKVSGIKRCNSLPEKVYTKLTLCVGRRQIFRII
jgi:hypothetical protein